jgi:hypothetical protein
MRSSWLILSVAACLAAPLAAETQWSHAKLPEAEFSARLVMDPERIEQLVGDQLDREFTLVEIKVQPLFEPIEPLQRTDFLLRCRYNNETSRAQSPDRIAGSSVLALEQKTKGGGGIFGQSRDAILTPGAGGGQPRRIDDGAPSIGSGGSKESETSLRPELQEDDSLLGLLTRRELPLIKTDEPFEGYLYFQVSSKRKLKHYFLFYDGPLGEFEMSFEK